MDNQLTPLKAAKLFNECPDYIQNLAKIRRYNGIAIIDSHTRKLRVLTYGSIETAREVAVAAAYLEIRDGVPIKWNREERVQLFNESRKPRKP
jgi:hypothetical protein